MPSYRSRAWNFPFINSLPLSVRTQKGLLRTGFEYFARIERNAELTAVPILARSGTMCRYFEKTSITLNRYLYLSLYLLRESISIKSHSQTSIILVTLYGFLRKRLRVGRCFVNASCCNNQSYTDCRADDVTESRNLATDPKAQGREGCGALRGDAALAWWRVWTLVGRGN